MKRSASCIPIALAISLAGCSAQKPEPETQAQTQASKEVPKETGLPGMPPVEDPSDIYAADHAGNLSPAVRAIPSRVYVPNSGSNTVDVIDPATYKIIGHFPVGKQPQHVVPSYDLKRLW